VWRIKLLQNNNNRKKININNTTKHTYGLLQEKKRKEKKREAACFVNNKSTQIIHSISWDPLHNNLNLCGNEQMVIIFDSRSEEGRKHLHISNLSRMEEYHSDTNPPWLFLRPSLPSFNHSLEKDFKSLIISALDSSKKKKKKRLVTREREI